MWFALAVPAAAVPLYVDEADHAEVVEIIAGMWPAAPVEPVVGDLPRGHDGLGWDGQQLTWVRAGHVQTFGAGHRSRQRPVADPGLAARCAPAGRLGPRDPRSRAAGSR